MANIAKPTNLNQIWAATGTKVDPGTVKTSIGWVVQLPPYEYQNWAMNRSDTAIAHFNQHGIPEWDVVTEYQGNLSYTQGSNGFIYKCLQTHIGLDPTNTNNNLYWRLAFEEYGSVQVVQSALNAHLANYATLSGISNVVLARANLSVYSKTEGDARYAYKGGDNATPFLVGTATNAQHAVPLSQISSLLTPATEAVFGTTRYATNTETEAGALDTRAITPLKAATVFLKKSNNLSDVPNKTTARTNLGLGDIATYSSTQVLLKVDNLAGLTNVALARSNLGLSDAGLFPSNTWHVRTNNFSDVIDKAAARTNLGLDPHVTTAGNAFLYKSENLAGLTNVALARANLGLGSMAERSATDFMLRTNNLADVASVAAARANLGLQDSVLYPSNTWLVRTSNLADIPDKAAARFNLGLSDSGLYPSNTWLLRGNNLGDLTNVQTARNNLGLGNLATKNAYNVSGDLDFTNYPVAGGGYAKIPGGMTIQWGQGPALGDDQGTTQGIHIAGQIMSVQITGIGAASNGVGPCFITDNWTTTSFRVWNNYNSGPSRPYTWVAYVFTG